VTWNFLKSVSFLNLLVLSFIETTLSVKITSLSLAAFLQSLNISKIRLEEEEATSKFTLNNVLNQITQIETDIKREIEIKDEQSIFFGDIYGTRSGDKGGCANLGVWAKNSKSFAFLIKYLSVDRLKELLPDLKDFDIDRYELANINSLNFYIHDILQDGVSSNNRKDGQAKSLGEYLRAKIINVPSNILEDK